jgi:hypothetical protein
VLLLLELVEAELLESLGECWCGELTFTDFLYNVSYEVPYVAQMCFCTLMLPTMSFLTGLKAAEPNTSTTISSDIHY